MGDTVERRRAQYCCQINVLVGKSWFNDRMVWLYSERHDATLIQELALLMFADVVPDLKAKDAGIASGDAANQSLAELTWFRVGGPAQVLFMPRAGRSAYFSRRIAGENFRDRDGLGSNLIVRDGGVPGVVIRLGGGFTR